MKKITFFCSLFVISLFVNSQNQRQTHINSLQASSNEKIISNPSEPKSIQTQTAIWSDNFSVPANWTFTSVPATGSKWVIGTGGPSGTYAIPKIQSTTASNGFALFDSDKLCSGNQIANLGTTNAIDLTGHAQVAVVFQEQYKRWFDSTFVFVSTDNWVTFVKFRVHNKWVNDQQTANPQLTSVNISSGITSNPSNVKIIFQFYSPSSLGADAGCAYSWQIDDVSIIDMPNNDMQLIKTTLDFSGQDFYEITPTSQLGSINFKSSAYNFGYNPQTNVTLHADINNGLFSSSTGLRNPITNFSPGIYDTLTASVNFAAANPAKYGVKLSLTQNELDEVPTNNIGDSIYFSVDSKKYLRSNSQNSFLTSYSFSGTLITTSSGMEYGANYQFINPSKIDSITTFIYRAVGSGNVVGKVYKINPTNDAATLVGQTAPFNPTGYQGSLNLPLVTPINVVAGSKYRVSIQLNITVGPDTIYIGTDKYYPGNYLLAGKSYVKKSMTWLWLTISDRVPIVGLYTTPALDAGNNIAISCGSSIQLNPVTALTGNLTYTWSPVSGLSDSNIANPIATPLNNTTYHLTVTNGAITLTDSITVSLTALSANVGTDKNIICGGSSQLDVSTNYTGLNSLNYLWDSASTLSSATIKNPIAQPSVTTTYTVTVSTQDGMCVATDQVAVIISPLIVTGNNLATVCGSPISLSTSTNYTGTGTLSYMWSPSTGLSTTSGSNPLCSTDHTTIYTVTVTTNNGCSAIGTETITINKLSPPQICIVLVDSTTGKNMIVWEKQVTNLLASYNIYKESVVFGTYTLIGNVPYTSLSSFVDYESTPGTHADRYKLSAIDICGNETNLSSPHRTLHLSLSPATPSGYSLVWTDSYEGFTFYTYNIYRIYNTGVVEQFAQIQNTFSGYTDQNPPQGVISYFVAAIKPGTPCSPSLGKMTGPYNESISNIEKNSISAGYTISGTMIYNNTSLSTLGNVSVKLMNGLNQIASAVTDINGTYVFNNIPNGSYSISATTTKPWGGVTATDALKMKRHISNLELLTEPIRLSAADVNASGNINSTDVLKVQRRIANLDQSFAKPDWNFEKPGVGGTGISVNGTNVNQNIYALCTGDVNGTNIPTHLARIAMLNLKTNSTIRVNKNEVFDLPIRISKTTETGAFQLFMNYPTDVFDIENITMKTSNENLMYHAENGELRIVWTDLYPLTFSDDEVLVNIRMKFVGDVTSENKAFSLQPVSEIADATGNIIYETDLNTSAIELLETAGISKTNLQNLFNIYPNPANKNILIDYVLNEETDVVISIQNMLGEKLATLINGKQKQGTQHLNFDIKKHNLADGVYMISFETAKQKLVKRVVVSGK